MNLKLIRRAVFGVVAGAVILFFPAGTWDFPLGWLYLGLTSLGGLVSIIYFYKRDPEFLARRLMYREKVTKQKILLLLLRAAVGLGFCLCGLDYRLGWSRTFFRPVPMWLAFMSLGFVLGAQVWFVWVGNANRFAASIIQVESGQTVMTGGPYRFVRHPMYSGFIVNWLFSPLALGSYVALAAFALGIPIVVVRLLNE